MTGELDFLDKKTIYLSGNQIVGVFDFASHDPLSVVLLAMTQSGVMRYTTVAEGVMGIVTTDYLGNFTGMFRRLGNEAGADRGIIAFSGPLDSPYTAKADTSIEAARKAAVGKGTPPAEGETLQNVTAELGFADGKEIFLRGNQIVGVFDFQAKDPLAVVLLAMTQSGVMRYTTTAEGVSGLVTTDYLGNFTGMYRRLTGKEAGADCGKVQWVGPQAATTTAKADTSIEAARKEAVSNGTPLPPAAGETLQNVTGELAFADGKTLYLSGNQIVGVFDFGANDPLAVVLLAMTQSGVTRYATTAEGVSGLVTTDYLGNFTGMYRRLGSNAGKENCGKVQWVGPQAATTTAKADTSIEAAMHVDIGEGTLPAGETLQNVTAELEFLDKKTIYLSGNQIVGVFDFGAKDPLAVVLLAMTQSGVTRYTTTAEGVSGLVTTDYLGNFIGMSRRLTGKEAGTDCGKVQGVRPQPPTSTSKATESISTARRNLDFGYSRCPNESPEGVTGELDFLDKKTIYLSGNQIVGVFDFGATDPLAVVLLAVTPNFIIKNNGKDLQWTSRSTGNPTGAIHRFGDSAGSNKGKTQWVDFSWDPTSESITMANSKLAILPSDPLFAAAGISKSDLQLKGVTGEMQFGDGYTIFFRGNQRVGTFNLKSMVVRKRGSA